jgi:hypothetical protein
MKASRVKADCFEVKVRTILKPRFTLIKVNTANCIKIEKPLGYYSIEWNEEWGDVESFDAVMQRITPIVTSSDIIDVYNGKLFFHTDKELDCEKSYVLYVKDSDDGEKCIVKPVDFSDINSFRVELDNGESASSSIKEDHINIFYHGGKPSSIKLFNKLVIDILLKFNTYPGLLVSIIIMIIVFNMGISPIKMARTVLDFFKFWNK